MIDVANLVKDYASYRALHNLSFSVGRGEIVGLLGRNGAGKSSTMRILSCFMPATAGTASVAGFDVFTESYEVRRRIGYMPENNPLPPEMRVREYLKFRARLKGMTRVHSRQRVDAVLEQCSLTEVSRKLIGHLSKGFRQRVGLADALVHDPELIILDEPTIGLDPNQIRSVRALIKSLAQKHTVLLSTHILPEVEMTCGRVLIMEQGRILADDTPENLQNHMNPEGMVRAEIAAPLEALQEWLADWASISRYDIAPGQGEYFVCSLTPHEGADLRESVYGECRDRHWNLRELTRARFSLEDIFVHVTRHNREEEH
ncbi:MAG TPA: ABC transporter [Verrucomicrobiales bacterium]|nr:ABC transporter [Verrucomicrobiales bacterium]